MTKRMISLGVIMFLSSSAFAEESILNRAASITSKLEVLNNLGRECEAHLQVEAMKGASSAECTKYLKNIRGEYFNSIGEECVSLSKWYESRRQFVIKNPSYADQQPDEAAQLVKEMKAVNRTCHPDNLASYKYLTKPLDTIKALGELE